MKVLVHKKKFDRGAAGSRFFKCSNFFLKINNELIIFKDKKLNKKNVLQNYSVDPFVLFLHQKYLNINSKDSAALLRDCLAYERLVQIPWFILIL